MPPRPETIEQLLKQVQDFSAQAREIREIILANLVMMGEIPAPTFGEEERIRFLLDRFTECRLDRISTDEVNNAFGILEGEGGEKNILVVAHTDTPFPTTADHTIRVEAQKVYGAGVADNSLGCAIIASLPNILDHLGIKLKNNLILMGATRSLGRGNLGGIRFFLENQKVPSDFAVCVEGAQLGRLSYTSIGMLRGVIHCNIPQEYDWTQFSSSTSGAITLLNEVITRMLAIPLPNKPKTTINFGSISSGQSFNAIPTFGTLQFEIRSEQIGMIAEMQEKVEEIVNEVASLSNTEVSLEILARRRPGGIPFSHPLTYNARKVMESLDISPIIIPSTGELAEMIAHEIPAITVGLTKAKHVHTDQENIAIAPIFRGIAQLVGILLAMDKGLCDEQ